MRKLLLTWVCCSLALLTACEYDDTDLKRRVDDLDERLTTVEELVATMNRNVEALQQLIDGKLFIRAVDDNGDGSYTIHLISADGATSTLVIRDGEDGRDGTTPNVGVKQDADGRYYWTIDGEWVLDAAGGKIPVTGRDGADGKDGENGVTPAFKIENGKWYVSYDRGINWVECGKATGDDGDAFFRSVVLSDDGRTAYVTLADGTVLTFAIYAKLDIAFTVDNELIMSGDTKAIPYVLTGADEHTTVEAVGKGRWEAEVEATDAESGHILVTAPETAQTGKVIVLVSDGAEKTVMRTLTFVSGALHVSTSSVEAPVAGGMFDVEITTNLDFEVVIPEEATWVRRVDATRNYEVRTETVRLQVDANATPYARSAKLQLVHRGLTIETILVYQQPVTYDAQTMVFVVKPLATDGNKVVLPLHVQTAGSLNCTIDWGDGSEPETVTAKEPSHVYENAEAEYTVQIEGTVDRLYRVTSSAHRSDIVDVIQWGKTGLKNMNGAFYGNKSLVRVPGDETGAFAEVTTIAEMFRECSALREVDPELLAHASGKLTMINGLFYRCESLETLPVNFFEKCTGVTRSDDLYGYCTKLTQVATLANTKVTTVQNTFRYCESLKTVPEGFFPPTVASATTIIQMFSNCLSLERIPADFFDNFSEKVTNMNLLFSGCEKLQLDNLDFINKFPKAYTWSSVFSGCKSLTCEVPAYTVVIDGEPVEVQLWERGNTEYRSYFANRTVSGGNCFNGCTGLVGYYDRIPQSWGGGWDGTTGPATIEVSAVLPEGHGYHAVDFILKGKNVVDAYYFLGSKEYVEEVLPSVNNSYAELCEQSGVKIDRDYLNALNSDQGLTLGYEEGKPETEYVLIASVKNMYGAAYNYCSQKTEPIPAGEEEYERYLGEWTVSCETIYDTARIGFDIRIDPFRVNESYKVWGWGITTFGQWAPIQFNYENGKLYVYNGAQYNQLLGSITREGTFYNIGLEPYAWWASEGCYTTYMPAPEKLVEGTYDTASNTVTVRGLPSSYYYDAYGFVCGGMDIFCITGGVGWITTHMFDEYLKDDPRYLYTYEGEQVPNMIQAPFLMERKAAASASVQRAAAAGIDVQEGSLKVSFNGEKPAEPQEYRGVGSIFYTGR